MTDVTAAQIIATTPTTTSSVLESALQRIELAAVSTFIPVATVLVVSITGVTPTGAVVGTLPFDQGRVATLQKGPLDERNIEET